MTIDQLFVIIITSCVTVIYSARWGWLNLSENQADFNMVWRDDGNKKTEGAFWYDYD